MVLCSFVGFTGMTIFWMLDVTISKSNGNRLEFIESIPIAGSVVLMHVRVIQGFGSKFTTITEPDLRYIFDKNRH